MTTHSHSEVWRDVPSVPGMQASSWGRVKMLPMVRIQRVGGPVTTKPLPTYGRVQKKNRDKYVRLIYMVKRNGRSKMVGIARAVCEAFHGPQPPDKPFALHIDENSTNNVPSNLYWGTQKENLNAPLYRAYRNAWRQQIVLADGFSF
jgi:hypothetical protein